MRIKASLFYWTMCAFSFAFGFVLGLIVCSVSNSQEHDQVRERGYASVKDRTDLMIVSIGSSHAAAGAWFKLAHGHPRAPPSIALRTCLLWLQGECDAVRWT